MKGLIPMLDFFIERSTTGYAHVSVEFLGMLKAALVESQAAHTEQEGECMCKGTGKWIKFGNRNTAEIIPCPNCTAQEGEYKTRWYFRDGKWWAGCAFVPFTAHTEPEGETCICDYLCDNAEIPTTIKNQIAKRKIKEAVKDLTKDGRFQWRDGQVYAEEILDYLDQQEDK